FLIFLLGADLSGIGYVFNKGIGSMVYNIGDRYVLGSLVRRLYLLLKEGILVEIGVIWLGDISMDGRVGYGVK
ncbi:DUF4260 family protein, partial [Staphylococcus saprophyticus]|uniref:DUF4260 family protein n=1 Tax=Staphylococcus saprophyticus TaxID=29385 RepID=UPI0011AA6189